MKCSKKIVYNTSSYIFLILNIYKNRLFNHSSNLTEIVKIIFFSSIIFAFMLCMFENISYDNC